MSRSRLWLEQYSQDDHYKNIKPISGVVVANADAPEQAFFLKLNLYKKKKKGLYDGGTVSGNATGVEIIIIY